MRLPLIFVIATTVIDSMGIGLILPVLPSLLREVADIPLADAALYGGVLVTAFAFMQFIFGPIIGALSDRYGRRPIMLISLLVMALDYIVMALAGAFWILLVGRMIGGVAAATQSTAYAFMADISKPEEKAARFGIIGAAFGMGFVFGPLLGGLLAEFGTRAPFYAAAALAALNLVFGYFVMPETLKDENRRPLSLARANPFGAFKNVSASPLLRRLLVLFFLYQVAFMVYPSIWAYYTEARFGWEPRMIGLSLAAFGIAMAIVQGGLIRYILRWLGDRGTILYGLAFNFFAFIILAFVESGFLAIIFIPLIALGAVVTPAVQGMMSRATSDNSQGELQGVLSSTSALATIISPLIMTQIFAAFAREDAAYFLPGAPFLLSMVLMVLCAVVFLATPRAQTA